MPHSMTGYGIGSASSEGLSVTVELRSVNNRFLDFSIKTPRALFPFEGEIRDFIQKRVSRGRISVFVSEEWSGDRGPDIRIDRARAASYARQLEQLSRELGLGGEVRLDHILTIDNLLLPGDEESYRLMLWELTREALGGALDQMTAGAAREGELLCDDISQRIEALEGVLSQTRELAADQVEGYRERLVHRLKELLDDSRLDRTRLETEVALAADRLDITEEMVRLESHLGLFRNTLASDGPAGKTLGFILQEMGREANTIASKSWSAPISQTAIRMKELLEQVREQAQNLV